MGAHKKVFAISEKPGIFDMTGRAKWSAWEEKKGMSQKEAQSAYIDFVDSLSSEPSEGRKVVSSCLAFSGIFSVGILFTCSFFPCSTQKESWGPVVSAFAAEEEVADRYKR